MELLAQDLLPNHPRYEFTVMPDAAPTIIEKPPIPYKVIRERSKKIYSNKFIPNWPESGDYSTFPTTGTWDCDIPYKMPPPFLEILRSRDAVKYIPLEYAPLGYQQRVLQSMHRPIYKTIIKILSRISSTKYTDVVIGEYNSVEIINKKNDNQNDSNLEYVLNGIHLNLEIKDDCDNEKYNEIVNQMLQYKPELTPYQITYIRDDIVKITRCVNECLTYIEIYELYIAFYNAINEANKSYIRKNWCIKMGPEIIERFLNKNDKKINITDRAYIISYPGDTSMIKNIYYFLNIHGMFIPFFTLHTHIDSINATESYSIGNGDIRLYSTLEVPVLNYSQTINNSLIAFICEIKGITQLITSDNIFHVNSTKLAKKILEKINEDVHGCSEYKLYYDLNYSMNIINLRVQGYSNVLKAIDAVLSRLTINNIKSIINEIPDDQELKHKESRYKESRYKESNKISSDILQKYKDIIKNSFNAIIEYKYLTRGVEQILLLITNSILSYVKHIVVENFQSIIINHQGYIYSRILIPDEEMTIKKVTSEIQESIRNNRDTLHKEQERLKKQYFIEFNKINSSDDSFDVKRNKKQELIKRYDLQKLERFERMCDKLFIQFNDNSEDAKSKIKKALDDIPEDDKFVYCVIDFNYFEYVIQPKTTFKIPVMLPWYNLTHHTATDCVLKIKITEDDIDKLYITDKGIIIKPNNEFNLIKIDKYSQYLSPITSFCYELEFAEERAALMGRGNSSNMFMILIVIIILIIIIVIISRSIEYFHDPSYK